MICSFEPYNGNEPYIFISYSHKDDDKVAPILERLHQEGFRIWFDDGIEWGEEFPIEIKRHLENCSVFIALHSKSSVSSLYCQMEFKYAISKNKKLLSIYLEEAKVIEELEFHVSTNQAAFLYRYDDKERFYRRLVSTRILQICRKDYDPNNLPEELIHEDEQNMNHHRRISYAQRVILSIIVAVIIIIAFLSKMPLSPEISDIEKNEPSNNTPNIESEQSYLSYVKEITDRDEFLYEYNDFDGDGSSELFALMQQGDINIYDGESATCELWFVNQSGAQRISEDIGYWDEKKTYLFDNRTYLILEQYLTTGSISKIWSVKEGNPFESYVSGKVYNFRREDDGGFSAYYSTTNGTTEIDEYGQKTDLGRTVIQYYFYMDKEDFREYGAIAITEEQFSNIPGGEDVVKFIKNASIEEIDPDIAWHRTYFQDHSTEGYKYEINNILYRENHTVTINLYMPTNNEEPCSVSEATCLDNYYLTYKISQDKLELIDSGGGRYDTCLLSGIATFPEKVAGQ